MNYFGKFCAISNVPIDLIEGDDLRIILIGFLLDLSEIGCANPFSK